ncbi:MAG: hypothetical protein R2692_00880 [Microbacterium sp.]
MMPANPFASTKTQAWDLDAEELAASFARSGVDEFAARQGCFAPSSWWRAWLIPGPQPHTE